MDTVMSIKLIATIATIALFLTACAPEQPPAPPAAFAAAQPFATAAPAPKPTAAPADHTGATAGDGSVVASQPAQANTQGAHAYEGDRQNSITVQAGDIVTCTNPDFSQPYTFKIMSIEPGHITVVADDPNITIRDNGGEMPYFLHNTESMAQGFELPICWARFTPLEKTPVVQTYSMQPGATVVRGQADGDL